MCLVAGALALHASLSVEQTGGEGVAVKGILQGLNNCSMSVLMMF